MIKMVIIDLGRLIRGRAASAERLESVGRYIVSFVNENKMYRDSPFIIPDDLDFVIYDCDLNEEGAEFFREYRDKYYGWVDRNVGREPNETRYLEKALVTFRKSRGADIKP